MKFASRTFTVAGIIGVLTIIPSYLMPLYLTTEQPLFYAAMSGILAWQPVFFLIGSDPVKYQGLIIPAIVEKWGWVLTLGILYWAGKISADDFLMMTPISFVLGGFFVAARIRLARSAPARLPASIQ